MPRWPSASPITARRGRPAGTWSKRRARSGLPGEVLLVANEIGLGIVPLGAETRRFRDEAGRLNQDLAAACERVTFVVAGLPLVLKS